MSYAGWNKRRRRQPLTRVRFVGGASDRIDVGDLTTINAAAKLSITVWFTLDKVGVNQCLFSRSNSTTAGAQIVFFVLSSNILRCDISDGTTVQITTGATVLAAGPWYKATVVYDGTQGTASARVALYLATSTDNGVTYTTDAAETLGITGTPPTTLLSPSGISAQIGNRTAGPIGLAGAMDELRLWNGTALSLGQVQAETIATNAVPAGLRYPMNGALLNTGSIGGFNGTATGGVMLQP